jgi:hypothetical protein
MEEAVEDRRAIGIAENVIRRVVRAFYEPEAVVVLEGLLRLGDKNSVRGEEIAQQLQLRHKLAESRISGAFRPCALSCTAQCTRFCCRVA